MIDNSWLNDPALTSLPPVKREYMIRLANEIEGKSKDDAIKAYIKIMNEMKSKGLTLTKAEGQMLVGHLMKHLTPKEKEMWEKISKTMNNK